MRRLVAAFALTLALATVSAHASPKLPDDPVAVIPFKNLNEEPTLDWLRMGIAETMISDLKKSGKVRVVERDQIDRALSEVLLQQKDGTSDDATAVKVGKLVGAKTIVVGSFQKAGADLRINARFVSVETGIVLDTAKTTGAATKVFALQDQVVDKLLGTAPVTRPKRKDTQKSFDAYRLYASALTVASDADKIGYLKKALALDPDFVYAAEDLAALERRLGGYMALREKATATQDAVFWTRLNDPSAPAYDRNIAAIQFLISKQNERQYRTVVDYSKKIIALDIPALPPPAVSASSFALFELVFSYNLLRQHDLALQAGEQYLHEYPTGAYFHAIDGVMRQIIDLRKKQTDAREKVAAHFAELDAEVAAIANRKTVNEHQREVYRTIDTARLRGIAGERCWYPMRYDMELYDVALANCEAFEKQFGDAPDLAAHGTYLQVVTDHCKALAELGRFEEAIPLARAFIAAHPPRPGDQGLDASFGGQLKMLTEMSWPTDVVP